MRILAAALVLAALAVGCGGGSDSPPPGPSISGTGLVRSDAGRVERPRAAIDDRAPGHQAMAFDVFRELARGENAAFSPFSLDQALAMAYAGARGDTREEIEKVMRYDDAIHEQMNVVDRALRDRAPNRLDIANAAWGQERFPFQRSFLDVLARHYGTGVRAVDYAGDFEGARREINDWVAEQTRDKVEELLAEGALDEQTRLVLVNALYLKARWSTVFNKDDTRDKPFHRDGEQPVAVPFVNDRRQVYGATTAEWDALELPYEDGRLAMLMVAPPKGKLDEFERGLEDGDDLDRILVSLLPADTLVEFPRFEIGSAHELVEPLKRLGIEEAFDKDDANFRGIADVDPPLYVSKVVQKVVIRTDEAGTEGAAATGVVMRVTSLPRQITMDRPFLFFVRDRPTGTILFMGRVADPSQASTK